MSGKVIKIIFVALILVFIPVFTDLVSVSVLNLSDTFSYILLGLLFVLGLLFLILVLRSPAPGLLRRYLVLTALNAVVIPVAVLIHNSTSGLSESRENIFFFLIAVIICPLGLVTGIIGSLILSFKYAQKPGIEPHSEYPEKNPQS
jgi:hypothetical protein